MLIVDGKRVVHSESLLVRNGQEAQMDVPLEGAVLKFSLKFEPGEPQSGKWTAEGDRTKFVFTGWGTTLGTCTSEPMKLGDIGNKKLYFQLANFAIADMNVAQFFLLLEESK